RASAVKKPPAYWKPGTQNGFFPTLDGFFSPLFELRAGGGLGCNVELPVRIEPARFEQPRNPVELPGAKDPQPPRWNLEHERPVRQSQPEGPPKAGSVDRRFVSTPER